jgi:hypothetical protein
VGYRGGLSMPRIRVHGTLSEWMARSDETASVATSISPLPETVILWAEPAADGGSFE